MAADPEVLRELLLSRAADARAILHNNEAMPEELRGPAKAWDAPTVGVPLADLREALKKAREIGERLE